MVGIAAVLVVGEAMMLHVDEAERAEARLGANASIEMRPSHVFSAGWMEIVLWLASCATVNSTNAAIVFNTVEIGHGHVPVSASTVDVVQSPAPPANSASVGAAARGTGSCGFGIRLMASICVE